MQLPCPFFFSGALLCWRSRRSQRSKQIRSQRRFVQTRLELTGTDQKGMFVVKGDLAPGDYKIIALSGLSADPLLDDEAIARLAPSATDLSLEPGSRKMLTVTVSTGVH